MGRVLGCSSPTRRLPNRHLGCGTRMGLWPDLLGSPEVHTVPCRNCSVEVRLPVKPKGEPTLDLANITNYLIEEKLMKPFRRLYSINPAAEYYRFKQRIMESPFERKSSKTPNFHTLPLISRGIRQKGMHRSCYNNNPTVPCISAVSFTASTLIAQT